MCAKRFNFHTSSISTKVPQCVEREKRQHQITPKHQKRLLSVTTSTPQVSQLKSPDALNVTRQLKFQGNSVTNPYLNTKCKVSSFKSPAKTTTIQALSSIATPPTKVSPLNSPKKTIRTWTNYSQTKTELKSEPASNKLHAFKIDWIDENVTTSEAMNIHILQKSNRQNKTFLTFWRANSDHVISKLRLLRWLANFVAAPKMRFILFRHRKWNWSRVFLS